MATETQARGGLFATKPVDALIADTEEAGSQLKRAVGLLDLTALGIGAIIGTGIFVILGEAIGDAGPAIILSFVLAGVTCAFSALSYAVLDVLRFRRWAFFFVVIGANAITIFVVPRFLDFRHAAEFFLGGIYRLAGPSPSADLRQVLEVAGTLAFKWLFLLYLYRNRIFLRV